MRIKFHFQLSDRLQFQDSWPVHVGEMTFSFLETSDGHSLVLATIIHQTVALSPNLELVGGRLQNISLRHGILLPLIFEKLESLKCALGLILPREINTDEYEVFFEAESAEENKQIKMTSWKVGRRDAPNRINFDIAAKGLLADPWPETDRKAAEFFRRGRQAINERFYVDAFVNYYFFLERLFAAGKFKKAEVIRNFLAEKTLVDAYQGLNETTRRDALVGSIPADKDAATFFTWLVNRRGFFQHQSETDPSRWLHSTQRTYSTDAYVMAELCLAVYSARNAGRIFSEELNQRYVNAAKGARATVKIVVDILGEDPGGQPVRKTYNIEAAGTKPTALMASQILMNALQLAGDNLISIRQITAVVDKTHQLVFSYNCGATD
jgi:hypothetical protein